MDLLAIETFMARKYTQEYRPFRLDNLPPEVKNKIYNGFSQKEILPLRLVCKKWREEIDDLYKFSITFHDENSQRMKWLHNLNLKLKECRMNFTPQSPSTLHNEIPAQSLIKYPKFLRSLSLAFESPEKSVKSVSIEILFLLLPKCAQYLEELNVKIHTPLRIRDTQPKLQCTLDNLKKLTLDFKDSKHFRNVLLEILKAASVSGKLNTFNIFVSNRSGIIDPYIIVPIFKLISAQEETLTELRIKLNGNLPPEFQSKEEMENIKANKYPKRLTLVELKFTGGIRSTELPTLASDLLIGQTNLQSFHLELDRGMQFFPLVQQIVDNNNNLHRVFLSLPKDNWRQKGWDFDVSVFCNCKTLKELHLSVKSFGLATISEDKVKLFNLQKLNLPNLTGLFLKGFCVPTIGFDGLFQQDLVHLKQVDLQSCGKGGFCGVNASVLDRILELPNIMGIKVTDFNCSGPEEIVRLNSAWMALYGRVYKNPTGFEVEWNSRDIDKIRKTRKNCDILERLICTL